MRKEDRIFTARDKEEQSRKMAQDARERSELTDFVWDSLAPGGKVSLKHSYLDQATCTPAVSPWRDAEIITREGNRIMLRFDDNETAGLERNEIVTLRMKTGGEQQTPSSTTSAKKHERARTPEKEPKTGEKEEQEGTKGEGIMPEPKVEEAKPSVLRRLKS